MPPEDEGKALGSKVPDGEALFAKVDSLLSRHRPGAGDAPPPPVLTDVIEEAIPGRQAVPRLTDAVRPGETPDTDPGRLRRLKAALYLALRDRLQLEVTLIQGADTPDLAHALSAKLPGVVRDAVNSVFGDETLMPPAGGGR